MAGTAKPKAGSPAWDLTLADNPKYLLELVKSLTGRAAKGDATAIDTLSKLLADHPELKPAVRQLDDLAERVEDCWVKAAAFGDAVAEAAVRDQVGRLKAELLGAAPGVLERILASAVAVAHLSFQHAAAVAGQKPPSAGVATARDRQLSAAQKRLFGAAKAWGLIAGKKAKGLRPKPGIKLFAPAAG